MQKLAHEDEHKGLHSWFTQNILGNRSYGTKTMFW